jgi:hypothetical protein
MRLKKFEDGKYYPSPSVPPYFRQELVRIGGLNPYRKPMLVLTWGMNKKWIRYGQYIPQYPGSCEVGQEVARSESGLYASREVSKWFGVPRWCIEKWYSFEEYCPQGVDYYEEKLRYSYEGGTYHLEGLTQREKQMMDVLGPPPTDGIYRCIYWLTDIHGGYAEPDRAVLTTLEDAYYRRNNSLDPTYAEQVSKDIAEVNARNERLAAERLYRMNSTVRLHAHRIADPARKNKGGSGAGIVFLPEEKKENHATTKSSTT